MCAFNDDGLASVRRTCVVIPRVVLTVTQFPLGSLMNRLTASAQGSLSAAFFYISIDTKSERLKGVEKDQCVDLEG